MALPAATQLRVELPTNALERVDELVEKGEYESRSDAIEAALNELLRERFPSLEPQYGGC